MVVPRNHAGQVLEVCCELLQLNHIVRLYVVPTPYELVEGLLFRFFVGQHLRVSLCVIDLTHLLQGYLLTCYLVHPLVGVDDRFITILV